MVSEFLPSDYRKLMQYKIKEKHIETIIVYGSCYGTAKIYAEAMAEQIQTESQLCRSGMFG